MISKAFMRIQRSDPNFHDVDGACLWTSVIEESQGKAFNIDPNVTSEQWLEHLMLRSKKSPFWYTPSDSRPLPRPIANTVIFKNVIEIQHAMDERNLFLKFPAVPRLNSAEWD